MKLGKETGSLVNYIYGNSTIGDVKIGDPATLTSWSDRSAATVTDVFAYGKYDYISVTKDISKVVGGTGYGDEVYEYSRDPNGYEETFRVVDGKLISVYKNTVTGRWIKRNSGGCFVGRRDSYRDPSF
jgi:hypothetical protein